MTPHEEVMNSMREMAEKFAAYGVALEMPPQSNKSLGTLYVDIDFGKKLSAQIKHDPKFTNPMGVYQGGFLCAGLDDVYGPLSYMAALKPVVTLNMNTSFVRPFSANDQTAIFSAEVISISKSIILMRAEVRTQSQKLIATSTNTSMILSEAQLAKGL